MRCYNGDDPVRQDSHTDFEYVRPFAKIHDTRTVIHEIPDTDRNYRYRGVFIDIFAIVLMSFVSLFISLVESFQTPFPCIVLNILKIDSEVGLRLFFHVCLAD